MSASSSSTTGSSSPSANSNRLSFEKSPYLLQHAHNPVDWFPWGPEAFEKAREENKPIFLSVGYSTCHWCHVMERESFENAEIGKLLNENFVNIKVDREERPDVDKVYMTFVQASTGGGGWPMSVWLTPDLKPIVGGTYFPPDDRYYGRPGFKTIVKLIAEQWKEKRAEIEGQGTKILDALMRASHASEHQSATVPAVTCTAKLYEMLDSSFDEERGGFGTAPKFPQPVNLGALFRLFHSEPNDETGARALHMCLLTLTKMANGGIHDHISQGFHRYSTDRTWHVPHFEKMLYDQGQLAVAYSEAYQITKDSLFADVARDIFAYVNRDLSHPAGGFYSAEDADSLPTASSSEKKEGAFCVWKFEELQHLLSGMVENQSIVSLADVFCHYYGVQEGGNVDPLQDPHDELKNQNVLIMTSSLEDTAAKFSLSVPEVMVALKKCQEILFQARQERPRPHLDNKMVSAWNGLMISGFAKGAQALSDPTLVTRAVGAARFLKENMFVSETGILLRSSYTSESDGVSQISKPIEGFADDYAFVIRGLLDLYEACYDEQWLEWAEQLQRKQNELFWDEEDGAYFSSAEGDSSIVLRMKDDQDGAEPSANSVSAMNLLRLAAMLNDRELHGKAERIFRVFSERLEKVPIAVPELASALMFYHATPKQIVVVGDKDSEDTQNLLKVVHSNFLPNKVLLLSSGQADSFVGHHLEIISQLTKVDGQATAYVCENFACSLPVNSPEELEKQLSS
ncbi:spermatogenesis-associated protein 20 isoform X2 [Aplysia californica]|nr:spermatogenesis-associated protein 20 isoform X2 [Aplysia californica]